MPNSNRSPKTGRGPGRAHNSPAGNNRRRGGGSGGKGGRRGSAGTAGRGSAGKSGRGSAGNRGEDQPRKQRQDQTPRQHQNQDPPLRDDITGRELDRSVTRQLRSLPERLAVPAARHLAAAAELLYSDPEAAYRHTLAAKARAARVSVVREACGEAAYAAGRFREALAEFKAARRLGGGSMYLAMMADCERGLGRPERALDLLRNPPSVDDVAERIEMRIVESGARRDLGDARGALRVLDGRELHSQDRAPWVPRLRYAYAEALLDDGQAGQARVWFERAAALDPDGLTDAVDRAAALEAAGITSQDESTGSD